MIIDSNYKDKNKDFANKAKDVPDYSNFVPSVVVKKNNYNLNNMKNQAIAGKENPFTMIGLVTAIINDLNDLRKKIEFLEKKVLPQYYGYFIVKENNSKNDE